MTNDKLNCQSNPADFDGVTNLFYLFMKCYYGLEGVRSYSESFGGLFVKQMWAVLEKKDSMLGLAIDFIFL